MIKQIPALAIYVFLLLSTVDLFRETVLDYKMAFHIKRAFEHKTPEEVLDRSFFFHPLLGEVRALCRQKGIPRLKVSWQVDNETLRQRVSEMLLPVTIDEKSDYTLTIGKKGTLLFFRVKSKLGQPVYENSVFIPSSLRERIR